jgi:hypothetical protein
MKGMRVYAALVAILFVVGAVWVTLSQRAGTSGPLRMLGKGEREYRQARELLLLNTYDATPVLLDFCTDRRKSVLARTQALKIIQDASFHSSQPGADTIVCRLLTEDSRELRLEAMKTLEGFGTLAGADELVKAYARETDTALCEQSRRTLLAGAASVRRRLDEVLRSGDTASADSCVALLERIPFGRCSAYALLANHYRRTGDLARASLYQRRAGIVWKWWVAGPLRSVKMAGYDTDYGAETRAFGPADVFVDRTGRREGWRRLTRGVTWGYLNAEDLFDWDEEFAAYFFVYLHAPTPRRALLMLGSDDAAKAWLNDSLVLSGKRVGVTREDDQVAKVDLKKGANRLLVKVIQDMGYWGLFCRLTDTTGTGMDDVLASLEEQPAQARLEPVLACLAAARSGRCALADSLDPNDDNVTRAAVEIATDGSAAPVRRAAAVRLLAILNRGRAVPAGERELLEAAGMLGSGGDPSGLLATMAEALVAMGTTRGVDLGIVLRGSSDKRVRAAGEGLVSAYCRTRLNAFDDVTSELRQFEISRTVNEVEALRPTDTLVLRTLSRYFGARGDTARARQVRAEE